MSNSFTSPPLLTDPARCTAGLTIRTTEIARLADSQNYSFAYGGTSNVVSQSWVESCFRFNDTTSTKVCEWYNISRFLTNFKIVFETIFDVCSTTTQLWEHSGYGEKIIVII